MFPVRSFALATFVIALGYQPIDVEYQAATPVFLFPDEAQEGQPLYMQAKATLDLLLITKRPGVAR